MYHFKLSFKPTCPEVRRGRFSFANTIAYSATQFQSNTTIAVDAPQNAAAIQLNPENPDFYVFSQNAGCKISNL